MALFPGIRLETCDEPLWNIQATIELQTSHVAKGCDRDNYSERALRKLCGGCDPLWPSPHPPCLCPSPIPPAFSRPSSTSLKNLSWDFPSSVVVRTTCFSLQRAQVQSLVGELRSCKPCCAQRQKESVLHLPLPIHKWSESCSVVSNSLRPHGLYSSWNSPGQNTGVGNLSRLQGPSQPRDPTWQADSLPAEPQGKPKNTGVGSLSLFQHLPDPEIETGSPESQANSLPTELLGKPIHRCVYIRASQGALVVKSLPTNAGDIKETQV